MTQASPLSFILKEIEEAQTSGFYYAAIALSLTLPDICSKLELDSSDDRYWRGTQKRYEGWCDRHVNTKLYDLTSNDLWELRGGVLHQGQMFGPPKARYARVVFILPDGLPRDFQVTTQIGEGTVPVHSITVNTFCKALTNAANEWVESKVGDEIVAKSMTQLVRYRPNGYEDHVGGFPVIA